jgi:protein TonB
VSLLTSTLIQGLAVTALVVAPLLAMQSLPEPQSRWSMGAYLPVVPTPPPAPPAPVKRVQPASAPKPPSPTAVVDHWVTPVDVPTGIPDVPIFEAGGVEGGIPSGVEGSIGAPVAGSPEVELPPEEPRGPVRPGGDVTHPRKIHDVKPVYPRIAREARVQGIVRVETTIDAEGEVVDLRVVDSVPLLDAAAIEAVRQWRYEPTYLNGTPVPVLLTVEVVFQLSS